MSSLKSGVVCLKVFKDDLCDPHGSAFLNVHDKMFWVGVFKFIISVYLKKKVY